MFEPAGKILAVVILAIAAGICVVLVREWRRAIASRKWPSTTGIVVSSTVEKHLGKGGATYAAVVAYHYAVDGRDLKADVVTRNWTSGTEEEAQQTSLRYPVGAVVTVYYDPQAPELAALETKLDARAYPCVLAATVTLGCFPVLLTWTDVPVRAAGALLQLVRWAFGWIVT